GWTSTGTEIQVTRSGLSLLLDKTYYISVKAKNKAGSWSQPGCSDGIKANLNAPVISSVQPANGSVAYTGDTINFSVSAQDAEGQKLSYQFLIDGKVIREWQGSSSFSWLAVNINPGVHSVRIEVSDGGRQAYKDIEMCLFRKPVSPP
ncbi:MAG: Ig-like domain-containing protein, partial [Candidatus Omnitrophota bacterium]|nr:Ig-like domain-containing protein [Candidatus Omnitrophota bacterium]